jgi:hypothetical protein
MSINFIFIIIRDINGSDVLYCYYIYSRSYIFEWLYIIIVAKDGVFDEEKLTCAIQ